MKKSLSVILALLMVLGLAAAGLVPAGATPPAELSKLSQAEQLTYFNLVVNQVRSQRPGFAQREMQKIDEIRTSLLGGIADSTINSIIKQYMPGEWWYNDIDNGQDNTGLFMSENANASDLRMQDITGITSVKEGGNWVIEVRVVDAVNPARGMGSSIGRIAWIATREDVIEELSDTVNADPAKATMRYHSGFASVTVNPEGKVISAANGFRVHFQANDVRSNGLRMDIAAAQSTEIQYAGFDWTDDNLPFPDGSLIPNGSPLKLEQSKWHDNLPAWLRWILRYVFFGWIWMK